MNTTPSRALMPFLVAGVAVTASLAQTFHSPPVSAPSRPSHASLPVGLTEAQLRSALPGKTLLRVEAGEFRRIAALHASQGRLISGPALAALVTAGSGSAGADTGSARRRAACAHADTLRQRACLDSLASKAAASSAADTLATAPRALQEIEAENRKDKDRDTVYIGPDGEEIERRGSSSEAPDEVYEERRQGYIGQLFVDIGRGDWDWDGDDWAVVIFVVVGVIVVGAFVLGGGKVLYDLATNKEKAPIFREAGVRFSYSGLAMYGSDGSPLYRDAYLVGARFAIGVERDVLSLGLALEGGSINLTVRGIETPDRILDFRGGYLVGGPMVRFGNYNPLAFSMEFLNGTSDHRNIGWISKARMVLAARSRHGLLMGGHLGAVFYDLKFSDGLVFRRGDLNRDLSMVFGIDAGWAF